MNIQEATPREIDTKLAELSELEAKARLRMNNLHAAMERMRTLKAVGADPFDYRHLDATVQKWMDAQDDVAELVGEIEPLDAEFRRRGGWARFFVVTNVGGHVHSSLNCSTCFRTTRFAWLPEFSDRTAPEMVATFGEMACTVCFPDAPTMRGYADEHSLMHKMGAAEKAAKQAVKDERAAKKAAKAITNPDGTKLRTEGHGLIETLHTAKAELTDAVMDLEHPWPNTNGYHEEQARVNIPTLLLAIAAKLGVSEDELLAEAKVKAAKKAKREGRI